MFETSLDQEVAYSIIGAEDKLPNLKGLKMRDLFAMSAIPICYKMDNDLEGIYDRIAEDAYKFADAMIKARVKK